MPDVVFGVRLPLTEPSLHLETSSLVSLPVFTLDLLSVVVVKTQRLSSDYIGLYIAVSAIVKFRPRVINGNLVVPARQ